MTDDMVLASEKTQVIITTHSPYLLNHLPPESLVVVEKVDGRTQCRRVADREEAKEVMLALGVGKAWYSGHLGGTP